MTGAIFDTFYAIGTFVAIYAFLKFFIAFGVTCSKYLNNGISTAILGILYPLKDVFVSIF